MEIGALVVAGFALLGCGALGGLAYGYRGERNSKCEEVIYLRGELAKARGEPPPSSRAQRSEQQESGRTFASVAGRT